MRKVLILAISVSALLAFSACGSKNAKLKKNDFIATQCDMVCSKDECNQVCTTVSGTLKKK